MKRYNCTVTLKIKHEIGNDNPDMGDANFTAYPNIAVESRYPLTPDEILTCAGLEKQKKNLIRWRVWDRPSEKFIIYQEGQA